GRGGKLHVGSEGNSSNLGKCVHVFPPSSERNKPLGSVPTQTTLYPLITSVGLTETLNIRSCVIPFPAGYHVAPLSSLFHYPASNVPPYHLPFLTGSAAKHKYM